LTDTGRVSGRPRWPFAPADREKHAILEILRGALETKGYEIYLDGCFLCIELPAFIIVGWTKNDRLSREINRFDVSL